MTSVDLSVAHPSHPLLETSRPQASAAPALELPQIMAQSGLSPVAVALRYAKLSMGPGKVSFPDFVRLRLFDDAFVEGPLEAFVGQRRNLEICHVINYRHDWFGLLENKITSRSYLEAYGLPTLPVAALYAPGMRTRAAHVLADAEALEQFLLDPKAYPLFGKPVEGFQSLGSVGLKGVTPDGRELECVDGTRMGLRDLVSEVVSTYTAGYVLQPLMRPHPQIEALCGARLATVRVATLLGDDGPQVLGAVWKIPGGANVADNYWRAGNLLAQVDLATGAVKRVVTGAGLGLAECAEHPDTGAPFAGFVHPHWEALCALALDGARLMRHVPLIGWDLACTADGPMIVEMNETPDFSLIQLAERKGILTPEFSAVVARHRLEGARRKKANQAAVSKL
jgi:Sugar-transfer associated ATP-grasp